VWKRHLTHVGEKQNENEVIWGNSERNRQLGRQLREIGWIVYRIQLDQSSNQWRALVSMTVNFPVT
jgi:hypothetical protein